MPEKEDSKAKPGINAGPFGGNAESHTDTAKGKRDVNILGRKAIPGPGIGAAVFMIILDIPVQIIIHQKDKKCGKNIDSRNSGKGIMHTVKSKQCRSGSGDVGIFKQFFGKQVHDHDAEKRWHKTPAKRRHAKNKDTKGDQDLSQMRMGGFVGC